MAVARPSTLDTVLAGPAPVGAMPPMAPAAPLAPRTGSILGRVLGDTAAIQGAAQSMLGSTLGDYDAEMAKTEASRQEQAKELEQQAAERQAILAEPMPAKPAMPALERVDTPAPTMPKVDPMRTLLQMLPIMAALGTAKTQDGAIMALNAGTAVLKAQDEGDKEAYATAHQQWLEGMKQTLENNRIAQDDYNNIISDREATWKDKMARLQASATVHGDRLALAALKAGQPEAIINRAKLLEQASGQLFGIYNPAVNQEMHNSQLNEQQRHNLASEMIDWFRAKKEPTATMNNVIGEIAQKKSAGQALTKGEEEVWTTYDKWRQSGGMGGLAALTGGAEAAPAAAPAPSAPAAPAMPPVSALKEGVVTTFRNGQKWTLVKGAPVQVK